MLPSSVEEGMLWPKAMAGVVRPVHVPTTPRWLLPREGFSSLHPPPYPRRRAFSRTCVVGYRNRPHHLRKRAERWSEATGGKRELVFRQLPWFFHAEFAFTKRSGSKGAKDNEVLPRMMISLISSPVTQTNGRQLPLKPAAMRRLGCPAR